MTKIVLITGAGRGIGAAIAAMAAGQGYAVAVNYRRDAAAAEAVVDRIRAAGGRAIAVQADVGQEQEVERLFLDVDRQLGPVDVLVNNAGMLGHCLVRDMDAGELERLFRANVFSMFFCARQAVQRMSTQTGGKGGAIINLSSVAARLGGLAGGCHYAASKGAIDAFTLALAKEVGTQGIRVNAVRPGLIQTQIHDIHGGLDAMETLARTTPLQRSGTPDEVAEAVLWLASPAASYIHGTVVDVAGGR
ncbi:SDR family oxidoreductase [Bordetella genomosp. 12]|uniref:NAD(P)-dependent oxidoreductase n=1 Tax=Bordetella genomosp. 12 TaxID=463035 RepID=A0A261VUC2_9BORD|nr:SDR family oxidoreductase [Bordetella genomosp. 12]OZI77708.1 NAD(P)-dependent oxidoreductase [Bordetella genomosp. 12]